MIGEDASRDYVGSKMLFKVRRGASNRLVTTASKSRSQQTTGRILPANWVKLIVRYLARVNSRRLSNCPLVDILTGLDGYMPFRLAWSFRQLVERPRPPLWYLLCARYSIWLLESLKLSITAFITEGKDSKLLYCTSLKTSHFSVSEGFSASQF